MTFIIIFFGIMTFVAGAVIVVNPDIIFGLLRNNLQKISLQVIAIGIRVVMGVLLIQYAGASKFPTAIEIIGWVSIIAAATFLVIGRRRFQGLMSRALSLSKPYGRAGGFVAMIFGGFLIHAFA
jgi:hypothetical protein